MDRASRCAPRPAHARIAPHQLDRRRARQHAVLRFPHLAHPTFPELVDELIATHTAGLTDVTSVTPDDPRRHHGHGDADVVGEHQVDERGSIDAGLDERQSLRRQHEKHERAHGSAGERRDERLAGRGGDEEGEDHDPGAGPRYAVDAEGAVGWPEAVRRPPEQVDLDADGADNLIDQAKLEKPIGVDPSAQRDGDDEQRDPDKYRRRDVRSEPAERARESWKILEKSRQGVKDRIGHGVAGGHEAQPLPRSRGEVGWEARRRCQGGIDSGGFGIRSAQDFPVHDRPFTGIQDWSVGC